MVDDLILDDVAAMLALDVGNMLAATASAGAQVRRGLAGLDHDVIDRVARAGQPRSVVVTGMGGSGISGQVLEALSHHCASIPVVSARGYGLPSWVGVDDLVISLSCSGTTEETISATQEAARRGARLVAITAADSPLHQFTQSVRAAEALLIDAQGRMPRASLWTLSTPLLMLGDALGIARVSEPELDATADMIDEIAHTCAVERMSFENPAKLLAMQLASSLPVVWGTGAIGPVAAYRLTSQLAENAKMPAISGEIPESQHNQVVAFDGRLAGATTAEAIFDDSDAAGHTLPMRLVLLRDSVEHPQTAKRADIVTDMAQRRGIPLSRVDATGAHMVQRLATLVATTDWASVYAALSLRIDPSPIGPINELKSRLVS